MRFTTLLSAALTLGVTAATGAQMDLTTLPPEPAEMCKKIASSERSLAECVAIAEEETGGEASSAQLMIQADPPQAIVSVYTNASRHEVTVNTTNGTILKTESFERFPGWEIKDQQMQTTDSGLMYYIIEPGTGATPGGPTSRVEVHYTGYFLDGNKFDSSVDRGQTATFGLNQVIRGWTEGVGMMSEGEKRKLIIPGDLAYGRQGRPGIPPNAMLVFDVELITVVSGAAE